MARKTWAFLALLCVTGFGAQTFAAETGMLYAKSDPPGATVVIEGKERGKTPVLVRDLPPGEITVELRFSGAKPVAQRVTVVAKRVARIDVHIELPGASLTIVSEPLEATVFMDNQEVGKTPLTLEDLAPGRHQLILLKDGHPRTARSVVLEPGSERVLEVKLGTAGVDETERSAAGESAVPAGKAVPVEVQLIFTMLKETVAKGNHSETRRNLVLALKQPDMAEFKQELLAAVRVVQALQAREDAIRDGADALVGKEVVLETTTGSRKGKVESVTVDGITLAAKIVIDGRTVGQTRATVKWSALAPEEQDRLAKSWKPEGPDGAVARALLALAHKERVEVARVAAVAGEHPLGKYLGQKGSAAIDEDAERAARSAWRLIDNAVRGGSVSAASVSGKIATFEKKHGDTQFAASIRDKVASLKAANARIAKAEKALGYRLGRRPRDAQEFGGHYYKLFKGRVDWARAKEMCMKARGHLACVESAEEAAYLFTLIRDNDAHMIMTGGTKRQGRWHWMNGSPFQYQRWSNWARDHLHEYGNGHYIVIWGTPGAEPGMWGTSTGSRKIGGFICEWEK